MQTPEETYWRARENVIQMFKDRKYQMIKSEDGGPGTTEDLKNLHISLEEFKTSYFPNSMDIVGVQTAEGLPVYVKMVFESPYMDKDSLYSKSDAPSVFKKLSESLGFPIKHEKTMSNLKDFFTLVKVLVVYNAKRKTHGYDTTTEKSFTQPEFANIELWPVHRLQVNIAHHQLTDPHRILSEPEKQEVLNRWNANVSMFPEYCIDDLLNRYYDGKPGNVYKISNGGMAPRYAVVIARKMPIRKK